jgi:hypothetical protein
MSKIQTVIITLENGKHAEFSGAFQIRPTDKMVLVRLENRVTGMERPPRQADEASSLAADVPLCRQCRAEPQIQPGMYRGLGEKCRQEKLIRAESQVTKAIKEKRA